MGGHAAATAECLRRNRRAPASGRKMFLLGHSVGGQSVCREGAHQDALLW